MKEGSRFVEGPSNASMPDATVIPVLHYPDVPAATAWLCEAFGFSERVRIGAHRTQINVGSGAIVVAQGGPGLRAEHFAASSVMVRVCHVDSHCEHARGAGAKVLSEPTSQPYGERQYSVADLAGRVWTFSQSEANVEPSSWGGAMVQGGENAA